MVTQIGLMDYDTLKRKKYSFPNYDLGVIYAYLKQNKNLNVRLITSFSEKNLSQYDKIYVFKNSPDTSHPAGNIINYYKYPIEEYGPGFINKPLRPFLLETREIIPDFTCYNGMLLFSTTYPKNPISWRIADRTYNTKFAPIRLYEIFQDEELKKDYPTQKYNMVFDNPTDILNNKEKLQYVMHLVDSGFKFSFVQSVDISLIKDTNILEQVFNEKKFAFFRKMVMASKLNENLEWLVDRALNHNQKIGLVMVRLPIHLGLESCFKEILLMGYYYHKSNNRIKLQPFYKIDDVSSHEFAYLACRYLITNPSQMSFYEYMCNSAFIKDGVKKEYIYHSEESYDYLFGRFGMPRRLVKLEDWLKANPDFYEHVFIGGQSDYKEVREKYYINSRMAFDINN